MGGKRGIASGDRCVCVCVEGGGGRERLYVRAE